MSQQFNKNIYVNVEIDHGIIKLCLNNEKGNRSNYKSFESNIVYK